MSKPKHKILETVVVKELYSAIDRYVESRGGKVIVIGGIEIQQWPGDAKMNFRIAIRCIGKKPIRERIERGKG
jgi:hypothetical protein